MGDEGSRELREEGKVDREEREEEEEEEEKKGRGRRKEEEEEEKKEEEELQPLSECEDTTYILKNFKAILFRKT